MASVVKSFAIVGVDAHLVEVETKGQQFSYWPLHQLI